MHTYLTSKLSLANLRFYLPDFVRTYCANEPKGDFPSIHPLGEPHFLSNTLFLSCLLFFVLVDLSLLSFFVQNFFLFFM